ncbi:TetR/AcrR family transcriptional regulator [Marivita hallyeonensis]|uniref:Transcriptional regulator, TetR family n=1 Tax=Marivita hallyeonensis TaxID=996342 RepID=A0A1M5TDV7_9RHOB|nr:TetR/AcrR family transcriptional regulator [Marivita hallyeonensis]SHH48876.1 transcriptional regulator, TetR family [Marivita hallyeonensis]
MKRRRFTKEDWLVHALSKLSELGPEALKLDAICESAARTKGSFYHHFEDHPAFLSALVEYWIEAQTEALIDAIPNDLDPEEKDRLLTEMAMDVDYRLELGIRELARRDSDLARRVADADRRRLAFLSDIYSERYNIPENDAEFAARIEYAAYIGTILTEPEMDKDAQRELAHRFQTVMKCYFEARKKA